MKTKSFYARWIFSLAILSLSFVAHADEFFTDHFVPPQPPVQIENKNNASSQNNNIVVLSTVNIQEVSIVSQDENKFKLNFGLYNRTLTQPSIRYAITLIKKDALHTLFDKKIYDDIVSLPENSVILKNIDYVAPSYLNGDFELMVVVVNQNGTTMAIVKAGDVRLKGNQDFVEIDNTSCYLNIQGDASNTKYTPTQGVDISSSENLVAFCDIKNHFKNDISLIPSLKTFRRNNFGKFVSEDKQEKIIFASEEKKQVSFLIPKAQEAQSYDIDLSFLNNTGGIVSNTVAFHYVLQGASATIQNIRLDKDQYQKGETAKVSFDWTDSADMFMGARGKGTKMDKVNFELSIKNNAGEFCSGSFGKELTRSNSGVQVAELDISIIRDCIDPRLSVSLKDSNGNVLDSGDYSILSKNFSHPKPTLEPESGVKQKVSKFNWVLIGVLLVIFILIFWLVRKSRSIRVLILLVFFSVGLFFSQQNAHADWFWATGDSTCDWYSYNSHTIWGGAWYYASLNKSTYYPGESMTVYGQAGTTASCSNGYSYAFLYGFGNWLTFYDGVNNFTWNNTVYNSAPAGAGSYSGDFTGYGSSGPLWDSFGDGSYGCHSMDYATHYYLSYSVCDNADWSPSDTWNYCYNYSIYQTTSCGDGRYVYGTYGGDGCASSTCSTTSCWDGCAWTQGTKCCDSSWSPATSSYCLGTGFWQYSNCGNWQYNYGTYSPASCAASTCFKSTCWNGCSYENGNYFGDNSCRATTCANSRCWNGCAWAPGTYLPSRCDSTTCTGSSCWDGCAYESGTYSGNGCESSTCSTTSCWDGCTQKQGTKCCDSSWSPATSSYCLGTGFWQYSNCGNWQYNYGTYSPASCAASTCSGSTCSNGCWNENGTYSGNGCESSTCSNSSCWNGCTWKTGTYTPSSCAASTCSGSTCWNGCSYENGTKTDTTWTAWSPDTSSSCTGTQFYQSRTGDCGGVEYQLVYGTATCAPTVGLSASSTSVAFKGSTNLSWITTNYPTSCTASTSSGASGGDWSGSGKSTSGSSDSVTDIKNSRTYTITCSNSAGSASSSVTVDLNCSPGYQCSDPCTANVCGDQSQSCVLSCTEDSAYCSGKCSSYVNCGECSTGKWKEN